MKEAKQGTKPSRRHLTTEGQLVDQHTKAAECNLDFTHRVARVG
jgi:hypothetical protein